MAAKIWKLNKLSSTAKFVLLALANHADDNGKCWPSQQKLSEATGFNERTIRRALAELEQGGYIEVSKEEHEDGHSRRVYIINPDGRPGCDEADTESGSEPDESPGLPDLKSTSPPDTESGGTGLKVRSYRTDDPVPPDLKSGPILRNETINESSIETINESGRTASKPFYLQDALAALYGEYPELRPSRDYKARMGGEVTTGLVGPLHQAITQGFVEAIQATPPAAAQDFVNLASWLKAGGLAWMSGGKSAWLAHICRNLPQMLDQASEWDRAGRPDLKKKPERGASWRPDPTIGSNTKDYAKETEEWLNRQD